jgi:hypothetical protein
LVNFLKKGRNKPPLFSGDFQPRGRNEKEIGELIKLVKIILNSI